MILIATIASLYASAPAAVSTQVEGAVSLREQRGAVEESAGGAVLRFSAVAATTLPVGVSAVQLGIIFAEDASVIAAADVAAVYRRGSPEPGQRLGVVVRRVPVALGAKASAPLELEAPLESGAPAPRTFVTHVLGYDLADATPKVLLELLGTRAASDEVAAVRALALDSPPRLRLAARQRWAASAGRLVPGLAAELARTIPDRPSEGDTARRVYAARALGVLGGDGAERALREILGDGDLARFDEPLQVLRIARVIGSPLETPLAQAIPPQAQRMADVIGAALEDCLGLADAASPGAQEGDVAAGAEGPAAEGASRGAVAAGEEITKAEAVSPAVLVSRIEEPAAWPGWLVALVIVGGSVLAFTGAWVTLAMVARSRRRRVTIPSGERSR